MIPTTTLSSLTAIIAGSPDLYSVIPYILDLIIKQYARKYYRDNCLHLCVKYNASSVHFFVTLSTTLIRCTMQIFISLLLLTVITPRVTDSVLSFLSRTSRGRDIRSPFIVWRWNGICSASSHMNPTR